MVFLNWHSNGPSAPLHSIPNVRKAAFCHVIIASLVILNSPLYVNVSAETDNETASTNINTLGFSQTTLKNTTELKTHDPHEDFNSTKKSSEIGVWFYAHKYLLNIPKDIVDQLGAKGINTIYFAGTDQEDWDNQSSRRVYSDFIQYAKEKGMKVYAVTLEDPSFASKTSVELEKTFRQFIDSTRDLFDTYVIDVEPHAILGPDPDTFIPEYIRMSHILGCIAQDEKIRYLDTVPFWYHALIKQIGISPGLDILASDGVNLMDYTYTSDQTLENIKEIEAEVKKPVTISIKITPGQQAPQLKTSELSKAMGELNSLSLNFTIYEAQYILSQ
jgi:hypothetical protein